MVRTSVTGRVLVDSTTKTLTQAVATDASFQLGGQTFALTRSLDTRRVSFNTSTRNGSSGDLGNWALPVLDTRLTNDQGGSTALGTVEPWREGARVWLQVPSSLGNLTQANALQYLSFTLTTTSQPLSSQPGAPVVVRPVFSTSDGWQLQANDGEESLPWVPQGYLLSGPDGTRYNLDAQGRVQAIRNARGEQWL